MVGRGGCVGGPCKQGCANDRGRIRKVREIWAFPQISSSTNGESWASMPPRSPRMHRAPDAPADQLPRLTLRMGARLQGFPAGLDVQGPGARAAPPDCQCAAANHGLRRWPCYPRSVDGQTDRLPSELSQARIETTGTYRETTSSALATAKELEPSTRGRLLESHDGWFMDNQEKREGGLGKNDFQRNSLLPMRNSAGDMSTMPVLA